MRFELHPENPQVRYIKECIKILDKGGVVVLPTDSGYVLGCNPYNKAGLKKLYYLKRAEKKLSMTLIVQNLSTINDFSFMDKSAFRYIKKLLPGPYTFIFECSPHGQKILGIKREEIGIRMPRHSFFKTLHEFYDQPILSTSAKASEEDNFSDPDEIENLWKNQIDAFMDIGIIEHKPTTMVSFINGQPELLRQGAGEVPL